VSVEEACSGIRYLLSLSFLAVVYADFARSGPWVMLGTMTAMAPIAILANALRVAATALMGTANPKWAAGAMHETCGWLIFVAAMAAGVGVHWCLARARKCLHA
jgi:exosortase/archaeosortase family protein